MMLIKKIKKLLEFLFDRLPAAIARYFGWPWPPSLILRSYKAAPTLPAAAPAVIPPTPGEALLSFIRDAALITIDGQITGGNSAVLAMSGFDAKAFAKLKLAEFIPQCEIQVTDCLNIRHSAWDTLVNAHKYSIINADGISIPVKLEAAWMPQEDTGEQLLLIVLKESDESGAARVAAGIVDEKRRFEVLFNHIRDAVFVAPLDEQGVHGNFVEVNDVACERLGYTRAELLSMNARQLNPSANLQRVYAFGRQIRRDGIAHFESIHVSKSGEQIPVDVTAKLISFNGQDFVMSVARDQRETKKLQMAESRFGRLIEHSWDEIYVFERDTLQFLQVNKGAMDNLGYSQTEMLRKRFTDIMTSLNEQQFQLLTQPLLDGKDSRVIFETTLRRKNGATYPGEVRLQLSHSEVPPVFLANVQDITARKQIEQRLMYLASYDTLTGLPNRTLFIDRAAMAMESAKRTETLVAVFFADLDGFKAVNDNFGHDIGDQLVQVTARRLQECVRKSDTVARIGGDEFTILLTNLKSCEAVEMIAKKILAAISQPIRIGATDIHTSTSIGITLFPLVDGDDVNSLLKQADLAMYYAKKSGKGMFMFYAAELAKRESRRAAVEAALKGALARKEFELYYQPRVMIEDGTIIGAEALLRWKNSELGSVGPAEFIPVLEASGDILQVGQWVIQTVCQQTERWLSAGYQLDVSFNVSPRQIQNENFVRELQATIQSSGVDAEYLELEITENVLITQASLVVERLRAIKQLGLKIALDDFGSGYSSLNYLRQFPIDVMKIDRAFVADLTRGKDAMVIVNAIVGLANSLNRRVMAEGIESFNQANLLIEHGCLEGQGYLYGRPMPVGDFEQRLSEQFSSTSAAAKKPIEKYSGRQG